MKMSGNGEIYTAGKNFTLPPAVTAWTNSTSGRTPAIFAAGDHNDCHEDDKDDDDYRQHFHQHQQQDCHLVDHEHSVPHNIPSPSVIRQVLTGGKFSLELSLLP